jgi:hypothetical protein
MAPKRTIERTIITRGLAKKLRAEPPFPILKLGDDVLKFILGFLEPKEVIQYTTVNKRIYSLVKDPQVIRSCTHIPKNTGMEDQY